LNDANPAKTPIQPSGPSGLSLVIRGPTNVIKAGDRIPNGGEAGEAFPRLLVDITNQGPMSFESTTNSTYWQLEVDGRWYVSKENDPKATRGADGQTQVRAGVATLFGVEPGHAWTNLPLVINAAWRVAGPRKAAQKCSVSAQPGRVRDSLTTGCAESLD